MAGPGADRGSSPSSSLSSSTSRARFLGVGLDLRGVFAAVLEPLEVGALAASWGAGVWEMLPNLIFSLGVLDEGVGEGPNLSLRDGRCDILERGM